MRDTGSGHSGRHLNPWLAGLATALTALHALLLVLWGEGQPLAILPWFVPTVHSFMALAALCIAFLAFGRYAVLGDPPSLWIGVAFSSFALFSVFYVLSAPGLLPNQPQGLIAGQLNTLGWFWHLQFSALAGFLLISLLVPWPRTRARSSHWAGWVMGGLAAAALGSWISVLFEGRLPTLVVGMAFSSLNVGWSGVILATMVAGGWLAARRYRLTGDSLFGYVALTELVLAFAVAIAILGGQLYDIWWYWQRVIWIAGISVMLFGLLSEYVRLYWRALHYAEVAGEQAAQLSATIENMADLLIVAGSSGRLINANQAAKVALGLPTAGDGSTPQADVTALVRLRRPDGQPIPPEENPFRVALQGRSVLGREARLQTADGKEIQVSINVSPVRDQAGEPCMVVAVMRDVTELKRLERVREEFLTTAAHELKTPVTAIKGYAQMMHKWAPEGHEPREGQAIQMINTQCDRISQRVQEMLEIVRTRSTPPELHMRLFDLGELAAELQHRTEVMGVPHPVALRREGDVTVLADRERIEEVLVSLLNNAGKYSSPGEQVEMRVWRQDDRVMVSVRDHGRGIAKERQPYIFEPFYEPIPPGAPGYQGVVALSLYLSKILVERHKGEIWFESEEGKGTTFYVSLPAAGSGDGEGGTKEP